ncbi:MAG TPA: hypothetical protein VK524_27045 [Polyangiaceae bacterium]|nr:hypothetical protein [Polyangiaceae bacterium]
MSVAEIFETLAHFATAAGVVWGAYTWKKTRDREWEVKLLDRAWALCREVTEAAADYDRTLSYFILECRAGQRTRVDGKNRQEFDQVIAAKNRFEVLRAVMPPEHDLHEASRLFDQAFYYVTSDQDDAEGPDLFRERALGMAHAAEKCALRVIASWNAQLWKSEQQTRAARGLLRDR